MTTQLITHPACLDHDPGPYHPENPRRLEAVLAALSEPAFAKLERVSAPRASDDQLCLVHPRSYVDGVLGSIPPQGRHQLDGDTVMSPGTLEAVMRCVGAACAGVDAVVAGEARNVFCATRPCGHHAEAERAMGFCVFNQAAIAARHAGRHHGLRRVAVIDFDVHHGNGTQHMFERDADLLYASTHEWPLYPGTGAAQEQGVAHNIVNAPLAGGSGGAEFRAAYTGKILPALDAFKPELVIISAGFDAHENDPLAGLRLHEDDYAWVTRALMEIARKHAQGRVVSCLEGGYDLDALAASSAAHVEALMAG
ncbi:MAG: histone deacetylase family protein [Alphaproteobacteria bacterium]|nr:histone deacetylase family protein [Alphaproteobacteria bacterium]